MARKRSGTSTLDAVEITVIILLVIFGIFYLNAFFGGRLNLFGILPRTGWGLLGVFFSPLLHYNAAHLTTNAVSLFILLVLLFMHREYKPDKTLLAIWLLSGFGTWIIGRGGVIHIGASGVIYGLVVYLIAAAWWLRSWRSVIIGIVVLCLYNGIFYGVLPQPGIISWEGHLSGAIAGFMIARAQHG